MDNDITSDNTQESGSVGHLQSDISPVTPKFSKLAIIIGIYCYLAYLINTNLSQLPLFILIVLVILAAIPLYFVGSYCMTMRKTVSSLTFNSTGWIARFFYAKRLSIHLWAAVLAVISALGIVVNIAAASDSDILLMAVSLFVFTFVYKHFVFRFMKEQVVGWACYAEALKWSVLPATGLFILLQFLLAYCTDWFTPNVYPTLQDAVANRNEIFTQSPLFNELLDLATFFRAVREYYLAKLSFGVSCDFLFTFLATAVTTGLHFTLFGFFFIPATERRRCLIARNIYSLDVPEPSRKSIFIQSLVGIIFFFVLIWAFAATEAGMGKKEVVDQIHNVSEGVKQVVFRIDDVFYSGDINNAVKTINARYEREILSLRRQMLRNNQAICNGMRANVDAYLDWYYSLSAEYLRIANIVIGNGEEFLTGKITEYLAKGLDTSGVERIERQMKATYEKWEEAVADAKQRCKISPADVGNRKVIDLPSDIFKVIAQSREETVSLNKRVSASTGVATVTAIVAAKIMSKPAAKLAAAALVKFAAQKTAGVGLSVGAGAAGGAAIGSVIPFFGTAVGAAVGGIVAGAAAWVATDAVVLKLEEAVSREDYKKEIFEAINAQCDSSY